MGYSEQTENRIRRATEKAKKKREEEYRLSQEGMPAMTYDEVVESRRNPDPYKEEGPSLFLDIDEEAAIRDRIGGKAVAKADAERTDTQSLGDRERWDKGDARIEEEENEAELQAEIESIEIEPVNEKELREQSKMARFASLGEAAYDESGGFPENDELGPAETPEDEAALQKKWKEEGVADQKTHEERQSAALAKAEEANSDAPLMKGGIAASSIAKDAPHVEQLERREDRLRDLGSGKSRGEIAAANNPVWQQAIADKAAREAAEPSIEEKAGIANKKTTAMDEAMRKAGHEVDRKISPTFINPDTGKEEGGAHYTPSKHDVINVRDDAGNIVGQKVVRKKGAPEDPDKPSPEEMKSRRDVYANKIREDAVTQKSERKRQAMIRTGDKHGIEQLDIRTAEGAATRLRDAEAAIRADETLTANEQAVAIQELKNKGTLDVTQSEVGGRSDVIKQEVAGRSDVTKQEVAGRSDVVEKTVDAAQIQLETKVEADETAAANLAVTNTATAAAQAEVDRLTAEVENEQDLKMQAEKQQHLDAMQDKLVLAQAAEAKAQREANKASEEREIAERKRSQTSAEDAASREGEAQGQRDRDLLDARDKSPEAVAARRRAAKTEAAENRAINQAILDDQSSTPGEQDAAQRAIRDANRVLTGDDGSTESNQIPVAESEDYLQNANVITYQNTVELSSYVNDPDGDEKDNWLSGNNTDALNIFVAEIRKNIKNGNIDVDELDSVGNILLSNMDPEIRESYERLIRVRDGQDDRFWNDEVTSQKGQEERNNYHNHADDTVTYLEQLFAGKNPTNTDPYVPITTAADAPGPHPDSLEGRQRQRQRDLNTPSPWGLN